MAYPFAPALNFRELKERLKKDFGCELKTKEVTVNEIPFSASYFLRTVGKEEIECPVKSYADHEMITPSVLRSICNTLRIDLTNFGYELR